jgi:hypothetical protein
MLDKIRRALRALTLCGIRNFIVTADHGFLYIPVVDTSTRIDPPGGQTLELHSRCWIGQGGEKSTGFLRASAGQLGLAGDYECAFPSGIAVFPVPGQTGYYHHGGASLQENVLPLCRFTSKAVTGAGATFIKVKIHFPKKKITNRFFSLVLQPSADGLFGTEMRTVQVALRSEQDSIGSVISATYGFNVASTKIDIEPERENTITMVINSVKNTKAVDLEIADAVTGQILDTIKSIPVELFS